ncbi:class I SAM-dependent methyltransferase [Rhodopseudomonas palustris]|uniref:Methyltransferase type 11 n=1 Tax=Rhodopseudomonas palustris (strain BisB18) TaxID=316056 RepID=Q21D24_RHOPB
MQGDEQNPGTMWPIDFFDSGFEETFRLLGKYDSTERDVANLIELVDLPRGARVLDVPCGWGRHSGVLNWLGYDVVGVDASPSQIARARQKWPSVEFHLADMRAAPGTAYGAVLNLWTSFGSLPSASDDADALAHWCSITEVGGALVMELTTREYAEASNRKGAETVTYKRVTHNGVTERAKFDWNAGLSVNTYVRGGWERTCVTRLYERPVLASMLRNAGYANIEIFGGFDGSPVQDDRRTVFVARRP